MSRLTGLLCFLSGGGIIIVLHLWIVTHSKSGTISNFKPVFYLDLLSDGYEDFDWKAYISSYSDLAKNNISTREQAVAHYRNHGFYEGRMFPRIDLDNPVYFHSLEKLSRFSFFVDQQPLPRVIVIYDIYETIMTSDIIMNNLLIFLMSIEESLIPMHATNIDSARSLEFYWFNVMSPDFENIVLSKWDREYMNVAFTTWPLKIEQNHAYSQSIKVLRTFLDLKFDYLLTLNSNFRGPFLSPSFNGSWIYYLAQAMRRFFEEREASPPISLSCIPHESPDYITSGVFSRNIRTNGFSERKPFKNMSKVLFMHPFYDGRDISFAVPSLISPDEAQRSCFCTKEKLPRNSILFLPAVPRFNWCELSERATELLVERKKKSVSIISKALKFPEVAARGKMYELSRQFEENRAQIRTSEEVGFQSVCFLVRSSSIHFDDEEDLAAALIMRTGLSTLISCRYPPHISFFISDFHRLNSTAQSE